MADFLTKVIAVKPSWERFWKFVNHQGSGSTKENPGPVDEPTNTVQVNRGQEQSATTRTPIFEESHPEEQHPGEGEHGRSEDLGFEDRDIACRCISIVECLTGMTQEYPEISEFKKNAVKTALGTLLQLFSKGSSEEMESMIDQWGLESLKPFVDKKDDPGQEDHPEKEEPRGILKRGNGSIKGSPQKPKRVKFWDENPPILKVFRVQDHHGHVPEEHSGEEEKLLQKINDTEGEQGEPNDAGLDRSDQEEHRVAEVAQRPGPREEGNLAAARSVELLGSTTRRVERKPSKRRSHGKEDQQPEKKINKKQGKEH